MESISYHYQEESLDLLQLSKIDRLTKDLFPIYLAGFMHSQETRPERLVDYYTDLRDHLVSAERVVVARSSSGEAQGFICSSIIETVHGRLYHLAGIIIDPKLHGQGVGSQLLRAELLETKAEFLAFHTQSSRMQALGQKMANLSSEDAALMADYIEHRQLVEGVDVSRYGGHSLYGDPKGLSQIALPGINAQAGDAKFLVGRISPAIRLSQEVQ